MICQFVGYQSWKKYCILIVFNGVCNWSVYLKPIFQKFKTHAKMDILILYNIFVFCVAVASFFSVFLNGLVCQVHF